MDSALRFVGLIIGLCLLLWKERCYLSLWFDLVLSISVVPHLAPVRWGVVFVAVLFLWGVVFSVGCGRVWV